MRNVTYISHSDSLEHAGFKYIKKYKNSKGNTVYVYDDAEGHKKTAGMERAMQRSNAYASSTRSASDKAHDRFGYYVDRKIAEGEKNATTESLVKTSMDSAMNKLHKASRAEDNARSQKLAYNKRLSSKSFSNTVIDPVKDKVSSVAKSITTPIKNAVDDALWKLDDIAFDVKLWLKYDAEDVIPDAVDSAKKGISSAAKKAKSLLDKGKSALSKLFGTTTKRTYGQEAVASYADRQGLTGEKVNTSSVLQRDDTFAKRAARTGPTEPSRGVDDEYAKELASNSRKNAITNEPREASINATRVRTVEDVRELYRQGKVSKEYLDEFEANSRKYR